AGFRRGVAEAGNETWGVEYEAETHVIRPVADSVRTGCDVLLAADQCLAVRAWREHPAIGKALGAHKFLQCVRDIIRRCYVLGPRARGPDKERRCTAL